MSGAILSGSARHYADAAFDVAREAGTFDTWLGALDDLARVLQVPAAYTVLTTPTVGEAEKLAAFDELVPNLPPHVRNFLRLLVERGRVREIPGIAVALRERVNRERGIVTADVTTAVPLDPETERTIAQRLGTFLRQDPSKLVIRSTVDPSIIGGVVARVGDTLIDDSVRGRLDRLKRTISVPAR